MQNQWRMPRVEFWKSRPSKKYLFMASSAPKSHGPLQHKRKNTAEHSCVVHTHRPNPQMNTHWVTWALTNPDAIALGTATPNLHCSPKAVACSWRGVRAGICIAATPLDGLTCCLQPAATVGLHKTAKPLNNFRKQLLGQEKEMHLMTTTVY